MHSAELRWTGLSSTAVPGHTNQEREASSSSYTGNIGWTEGECVSQSALLRERRDLGREQLQAATAAVPAADLPALAGGSGSVSGTMIGCHRLAWRTMPHLIWQNTFNIFVSRISSQWSFLKKNFISYQLIYSPFNWNRARSYKKFWDDATSAVGLYQPNTQLHSRGGLTGL